MKTYMLRDLDKLAKTTSFNRDSLEKVLRLAEILKFFNTNEEIKNKYVLKGGTAINLCIFDFPRLSVDIDMNFNCDCGRDEMLEIREKHRRIIRAYVSLEGYTVDQNSRFSFALDSYLLKYTNAIGRPDNIKLELNYSNRIQILNPEGYCIKSTIIDNQEIMGQNRIELYAGKIAALIGRTTARDVFDVYEMIQSEMFVNEELPCLRKCSIFYLMTSNRGQSLEALLKKFFINLNGMTYGTIRRNLIPVLHIGSRIDLAMYMKTIEDFMKSLFRLEDREQEFIDSFIRGEYNPELLFQNDIANKLKNHPMALWMIQNHNS